MSSVHESLYRLDQFADLEASDLLPRLVAPLREAFALPVAVDYDIDNLVLDRDSATPLALIVSEVVTNSMKYGFHNGRPGELKIALKQMGDGWLLLSIADNGVGFEPTKSVSGMGTKLIHAMVHQLGGSYEYKQDGGTVFEATLPGSSSLLATT